MPTAAAAAEELDLPSEGFWWDADHERWYRLSVDEEEDLEPVLTAVLGP